MKCSHWTDDSRTERTESGRVVVVDDSQRCKETATVWLHAPDGLKVPGCWYCLPHANAIVAEYREKLGENWTAKEVDEFGNVKQPTMNEIAITRAGDTYAVQFPQREFVLTRRDDALTIAQYYADQHGIPVVEDGKTIYTPVERNRAQATPKPYKLRVTPLGSVECLYCEHNLDGTADDPTPPTSDDAAWEELAKQHFQGCEWIKTRAHQNHMTTQAR